MRRIRVLEAGGIQCRGATLPAGADLPVDDDLAAIYIANGWAEDGETGEIGERVPGARAITPAKITQAAS